MNKLSIALLGFFLFLSCLVSQSHGRQGDALNRFLKAKLNRKNGISTNIYEGIDIADKAKFFPQAGLKRKDKIKKLPGQPAVDFTQYGGYVTVNETAGRAFFYYFVEAEHDKVSKPLVLWLNGGPGCSSLAYGAMEELGPFRVHSDGKTLYENPFAWNKVANVLFLESPAGVGFSYSNTTADYAGGDWKTAKDNYLFLANWLERFPEYKSRAFYITGESYAGHYVPELAHTILHHNKKSGKNVINLKGIMIGNAVINDETDAKGMYDYFWTHSLISDEDHFTINKYCNFSPEATTQKNECVQASKNVGKSINSIDIYNIYYPLCMNSNLTVKAKKTSPMKFDPCSDYYVYAYLNHPDVQKALHANVTHLSYDWQPCSDVITSWEDGPHSMLPFLKEFMANGLRVWVFSGDTDGRVPVTSTRYSLDKLELPVKTSWYPWFLKGEVGGYTIQYKGDLTFATVRGAGHEVPSYQPRRALSLIKYFLDGKPLPSS